MARDWGDDRKLSRVVTPFPATSVTHRWSGRLKFFKKMEKFFRVQVRTSAHFQVRILPAPLCCNSLRSEFAVPDAENGQFDLGSRPWTYFKLALEARWGLGRERTVDQGCRPGPVGRVRDVRVRQGGGANACKRIFARLARMVRILR